MNLYDACYEWMIQRKIGFIDMILPFYVSAACCHMLNLENKRREFYFEHGQPADLRMHMFLVAPPGYMKTFILKRFLDRRNSVFGNTTIKTAFLGSLTEAGFVGTIRHSDSGEAIQTPGAAYDFMDHVLGIDEFSALTNMMTMDHSKNLDNAMLTALDSGYLIKRLAAGELRYETHLTLLTGSQPARYNLASGLGRRFLFIYFVPNKKQQDLMRVFRRQGKGIQGDQGLTDRVHILTEKFTDNIKRINQLSFGESIYKGLDKLNVPHFEEPLYEKIALGYNLATRQITPDFQIECNNVIEKIWQAERGWRYSVKSGAQDAQVMQFIIETPGIEEKDLKMKLLDFGMSFAETAIAIESLYRQKRIGIAFDTKDKKIKRRFFWPYH